MRRKDNIIVTRRYDSPCGELLLGSFESRLCLCLWQTERERSVLRRVQRMTGAGLRDGSSDVLDIACRQLDEYFKGARTAFTVPLMLVGTAFQRNVWQSLMAIPYGQVITYGRQADALGIPKAVRAVAQANAANPVSIIVPCHRVVACGGSIGGYAGGTDAKRRLMELERLSQTVLI